MRWVKQNFALLFIFVPLTWAGSFIAGKYVVNAISPVDSVFWRFLFSAAIMFPFLLVWQRNRHPQLFNGRYLYHLIIVVVTSGIIYHIFFFRGLQKTSPTNAAAIIALNPFFTAIGEYFVFKTKRISRFYFGFVLAFLGALWVIIARGNGLTVPGRGELFCLIASVSWSVYTIFARKTKEPEWDPLWIAAYNYLITSLLILPFVSNIFNLEILPNIPIPAWSGLIYMAIFPTAIGYTFYYIGVQKRGPAWAALYIYLVPSLTASLDFIFFKTPFTVPLVAGSAMVVGGLIIGNYKTGRMSGTAA